MADGAVGLATGEGGGVGRATLCEMEKVPDQNLSGEAEQEVGAEPEAEARGQAT